MARLSVEQKSELRRKYERLDLSHQGDYSGDPALRQLNTQEILRIFEKNGADPQKWPTFTQLEDYIRNIARLKSFGVPVSL